MQLPECRVTISLTLSLTQHFIAVHTDQGNSSTQANGADVHSPIASSLDPAEDRMSLEDEEDFFDASQHTPADLSSPVAPLNVSFGNPDEQTDTVADNVHAPVDDSDAQSQITASQSSQQSQESQDAVDDRDMPTMRGKFKTKSVGVCT